MDIRYVALVCIAALIFALPVAAEDDEHTISASDEYIGGRFARGLSDSLYPAVGLTMLYYLTGDSYNKETGRQIADSIVASGGITQLLKTTIDDRRPFPHSVNTRGFPSGHATLSFATAKVVADRDEGLEVPAYVAAGLISWSRHQTLQHHWHQILAGAAIGYWAGHQASRGRLHIFADDNPANGASSFASSDSVGGVELGQPWVIYSVDF
ncbi:MAG: phosphatase PAP2 family protein [Armatimonadota bacterium]